jgi:hypothetical protein
MQTVLWSSTLPATYAIVVFIISKIAGCELSATRTEDIWFQVADQTFTFL